MSLSNILGVQVLEELAKYTGESKRLRYKEIYKLLVDEFRIESRFDTVSDCIRELKNIGLVEGDRRGCYLIREFSSTEIRMMIDGIYYGKSISEKDATQIIDKLKNISPVDIKNRLKNLSYHEKYNRTDNEKTASIIDVLDEAITSQMKVEITGCHYKIDKKMHPNDRTFTTTPYNIVSDKQMYYLICSGTHARPKPELEMRRIDRMWDVRIKKMETGDPVRNYLCGETELDLSKWMEEHIYMFSGECVLVELKIKAENIGELIDWYGKNFTIEKTIGDKDTPEYVIVKLVVNTKALFFWLLQYYRIVTVLSPAGLREKLRQAGKDISDAYAIEIQDRC